MRIVLASILASVSVLLAIPCWGAGAALDPPLDFDRLVFVKRHPGRFPHMCDQYYGSFARPGGGLFILEDLRKNPRARDVVGGGLPPGSFLSPELSHDAGRILFAYARAREDRGEGARWAPEVCYHIYEVRTDGTGLRQLTDGPFDDFDPCCLGDGRIVFVSTRRGGFCRCGDRPVPSYTLHIMNADGTDIRRISHHETNEWHPALLEDGRIVYTRWDYVDRHTNIAHSLWTCYPDGSDPAALFGNYSFERGPWGEWTPRPVPGSHEVVAVAGAHHGHAIGSLILVDPAKAAGGSGPVVRLTPDVVFPEAEGWPTQAYATPFPLGKDSYLASYSPSWSTRDATHGVAMGIYLVDASGRRELLYRDPLISSMDPLPLRPRAAPPLHVPALDGAPAGEGEFLLLDVSRSTEPLPAAIKELRIIEILPKSTFRNDEPRISAARQVSARFLLGTVPVEEDGSAYFRAPAGVPLYFQAVDAEGMACQSMRTITYLQSGERRTCIGCHEPRSTAPPNRAPLAARRAPSVIRPGPDGTMPFSYPRLVQPVLDRRCVSCHGAKHPAAGVRLTGDFTPSSEPHSESYHSLAKRDLVPWFDSINGTEWLPRTYPGEFGARVSKLLALVRGGHGGASLPRDEIERLAIWIDLNVPFYGAYEPQHVAAQRAGRTIPLEEILK
jgi:hydrazine synthase alpha subunit-like protein